MGEEVLSRAFEVASPYLTPRDMVRGYLSRAYALWTGGQDDLASADIDEALELVREHGMTLPAIDVLDVAVYIEVLRGRPSRARALQEEATRLLKKCPSQVFGAFLQFSHAYLLVLEQRSNEAYPLFFDASERAMEAGATLRGELARAFHATLMVARSDVAELRSVAPKLQVFFGNRRRISRIPLGSP